MAQEFEQNAQSVWKRNEIESPCIQICSIHPNTGLCVGCYRSREEIALWSRFTAQTRQDLIKKLPERAASMAVRRGGRKGRI